MNLGEKEVAILIAMHKAVAITEQNALTFKEIAESCDIEINSGRLVDMRTKSLLRSTGGSLNKWWLTPAGVERAELEMMHTELKAPQYDPKEVAFNGDEVEAPLTSEQKAMGMIAGFVLGDRSHAGTQLFTEDDKLIAFDDIQKVISFGKEACFQSTCDFEVYALVPVGSLQSRLVIDWVPVGVWYEQNEHYPLQNGSNGG